MPKSIKNLVSSFVVQTGNPAESGTYTSSNVNTNANPWTFWKNGNEADYSVPHITLFTNDFNANGFLVGLHITYYWQNAAPKPIHLFFDVNDQSQALYRNADVSRVGQQDQNAAQLDAANKARVYVLLAQQFLIKAFPKKQAAGAF